MSKISTALTLRKEDTRNPKPAIVPVHFTLTEIKQHFDEGMDSIRQQGVIADTLEQNGHMQECMNIYRSQIVFLEGIFDFYVHEISKYALYQMFVGNWPKSQSYGNRRILLRDLEIALNAQKPEEWFFKYMNDSISREVYLSVASLKDQLNTVGIPYVDVMSKAFPASDQGESKRKGDDIVKKLFDRRNKIVHQGDREHASALQESITGQYVSDAFNNVIAIVNAVQEIAKSRESKSE